MSIQKNSVDKLKQGRRIAFIAVGVAFMLAVMKAVVGFLFDSKVLIADAYHSGADLVAIFASWFGLWLASQKKSEKFPYGLYKAETLVTLGIGILFVWVGIEIMRDGFQKIFCRAAAQEFPLLPAAASVVSIIAAYVIARKEKKIGSVIGSQSLIANANESFLDIVTSSVVLAGILFAYAKISYIEGAVIMLIAGLIFKLGLGNTWKSLMALLDANVDPQLQSEIENAINSIYGVKGVGSVRIRQTGPFKMVECTVETSPSLSLYQAHALADKAEESISKNYQQVESVFIHVEPSKKKDVSAIIPVSDMQGLDSKVSGHFGRAPYYVILKISDQGAEIEDFYYNEFLGEQKHIGIKVIKTVIKYKLDLLFTAEIGELSFYMLKDNFVDVYKAAENLSVREIIEQYRSKRLELLHSFTHTLEESKTSLH